MADNSIFSNYVCDNAPKYGFRICLECEKQIPLKIKRDIDRKSYCSRECRGRYIGRSRDMQIMWDKCHTPEANAKKAHHGENNPRWKPIGSKQIRYDGYIKVKQADGSWEFEHRAITGADSCFIVHHLDENKGNNEFDNLMVMARGDHSRLHCRQKTDFGRKWSAKFDSCTSCGGTERKHVSHGLCDRCYQRKNRDAIRQQAARAADECRRP